MKKLTLLSVIVGAAFLSAAPFSLQWSQKSVVLSLDSADARVGRPLTATSVAGVNRRVHRRAYRAAYYYYIAPGSGRDELHRRALHRLGDRLGIAEVVLLPSRVGAHIFGWHQPSVVTKRCKFAVRWYAPTQASMPIRHGGKSARRLTIPDTSWHRACMPHRSERRSDRPSIPNGSAMSA